MIISFVFKLMSGVPPITRVLILTTIFMAISINIQICDDTLFYFDIDRISRKKEYWRLFTPILFHGKFSTFSLINAYIFYQYTAGLEEQTFRTKSDDFFYLLCLIFGFLIGICYLTEVPYISHWFLEIIIYLWSKDNHNQIIHMMGFFRMRAGHLPFFYFFFTLILGGSLFSNIMGMVFGHILYYLYFVVPKLPFTRGVNILAAPKFVKTVIGWLQLDSNREIVLEEGDFVADEDFAINNIPNAM